MAERPNTTAARCAPAPPPPKAAGEAPRSTASRIGRLIAGIFLSVWLLGWTVGIFAALAVFGEGEGAGFEDTVLWVWIGVAVVAWWFAFRALMRIVRGEPIGRAKATDPASARRATRPPTTRRRHDGRDPGDRGGGSDGGPDSGGDGGGSDGGGGGD